MGPTIERAIRPTSQTFLSGGVSRLEEWQQNYQMSLRQGLMTGGDLSVRLSNNIFETNSNRVDFNPSFTPGASLNLNQPLLRDFWEGGRLYAIADLDAQAAGYRLESRLLTLVSDTEQAYWDLVAAREEIRVREQSLTLVKNLLKINQEKAKAGMLARLDVLQAEASLAVREGSLLESQRALAKAEDRMRRLIEPESGEEAWRTAIVPVDRPLFQAKEASFEASWAIARDKRPDLKESKLETDKQQAMVDQAGNRLWPRLDVTGQAGVTNLASNQTVAISDLQKAQNFNLQAGVALEWPLGPNADRDAYEMAKLRSQQAGVSQKNVLQTAFVEVREGVRDVTINAKRVETTTLAKKLSAAKLDAEQEKLKAGLSTNFQVLEFQKDFEEASLAEVMATIEYLQSLTRLERAQGTLLAARGLLEPAERKFDWKP
jgi:outer membrane protein TolC